MRVGALVMAIALSAACTSSSTHASSASAPASSAAATARPAGAATAGLSLEVSGDLTGSTDALSTKVSRCTSVNGQFFFEGTVSLGGSELDVKLSMAPDASIEIDDLAAGLSWSAPSERDPAATISMKAETATSGSFTASPAFAGTEASGGATDAPPHHLDVRGTYRC